MTVKNQEEVYVNRKKWDYICCDCGRKFREPVDECPRCVKNGLPGERVDRICCNTCLHVEEIDVEGTHVKCGKDCKWHELGDRCDLYTMMESNVPIYRM